tara:strand:+ start:4724 stop:5053 length:330 start_codon:yes stop_codon:yes gene_type:complete
MATKEEIKKAKDAIKKTDEAIKADLKLSKGLQEFLEEDTSPEEAKRRVKMFIENPELFRDLGTDVPIIKKAKGGSVLKEATDDRNRTPKRSICRGGGAAMKGVKFTGVK